MYQIGFSNSFSSSLASVSFSSASFFPSLYSFNPLLYFFKPLLYEDNPFSYFLYDELYSSLFDWYSLYPLSIVFLVDSSVSKPFNCSFKMFNCVL